MKLRFGESNSSLQDVEMMLRGVVNAKRIQSQIHARTNAAGTEGKTMLQQALIDRQARLRSSEDESDRAQYALEQSQQVSSKILV